MMPKVSVCISVYNTSHLLPRCLDSVVTQSLKEIEVILVNNGSNDNSLQIMEEYQQRFPEIIKIFSQEDRGLAQGRQSGINNATGEYITFLDADDYVTEDAYEKMYTSAIAKGVDIVECNTIREGSLIGSNYEGVQKAKKVLKDYFYNGDVPSMMWMRLYRKQLFDQPVFPDIYVNNEDVFAFPYLLFKAEDIYFLKEQLHFYTTDNEYSVMRGIKKKAVQEDKIIKNRIKTLYVKQHLEDKIGKRVIASQFSEEFRTYCARLILDFCLNDFRTLSSKKTVKVALDKAEVNYADIKSSYKNIKYNNKLIQKLINTFGLEKTTKLYRILTRLRAIVKPA
mgnify:CR=1 FL=1